MATVPKIIKFSGVGIHSGIKTTVKIKPSKKFGIFFIRTDIKGAHPVEASYKNVFDVTKWNTTIGKKPNEVQTIEHLMAALFLCGIDSATIEIDGAEMPILDGSANEFIDIISRVKKPGVVSRKIIVKKEVIAYRREVIKKLPLLNRIYLFLHNLKTGRREDGWVKLSPNKNGFLIKATLDYPDKIIGVQSSEYLYDGTKKSFDKFIKDISKSRTFGRIWEWEYMKKKGMGRGATGENLIAINEDGTDTFNDIFNRGGAARDTAIEKYGHLLPRDMKMTPLHSPDEFVRHKIIDAIGDIFTSGGFVYGTLESHKGSHGLNNLVLRKLFSDPDNYEIVE